VKHTAQVFDGVDGFAGVFDGHVGRIGNVFDEETQVVPRLVASDQRMGRCLRAKIGDAVRQVLVGIIALRFQFVQELFGAVGLLDLLFARSEPDLLIP